MSNIKEYLIGRIKKLNIEIYDKRGFGHSDRLNGMLDEAKEALLKELEERS